MGELVFFAIIILFSIAESIARSRKAKAKRESGQVETERFEWAQTPPWEAEVPTYDDDPSYDDPPSRDDARSYEEAERTPERPSPAPSGQSAADVWAEIAGLASGTKERAAPKPHEASRPSPAPSPPSATPVDASPPAPRTSSYVEAARARLAAEKLAAKRPSAPASVHRVHLAHVGYGTDPSERAASEQDGLDPLAEHMSANAAAVHKQLRSRNTSVLRQAIILREVLDPPIALRD